jgi:hypothetical protein
MSTTKSTKVTKNESIRKPKIMNHRGTEPTEKRLSGRVLSEHHDGHEDEFRGVTGEILQPSSSQEFPAFQAALRRLPPARHDDIHLAEGEGPGGRVGGLGALRCRGFSRRVCEALSPTRFGEEAQSLRTSL